MGFVHLVSLRTGAFATLAAVGLLVLTAALLAGAVLVSQQLLLDRSRAEKSLEARSHAWDVVGTLLTALQQTWNADEQTLDTWWTQNSQGFPDGTELISLSSRVNLNSMTPFLLHDSELNATLLARSVEDFTTYRINKGPFSRIEDYKDYFQPGALNTLYCVQSLFNVNTADEIILEKILAARTGNETLAATIRARLREYRSNRQVLVKSDLDTLLGGEKDAVGDLLTTDPELDVNTASVAVLQALLRDPDWKLDQRDAKLQVIVTNRVSKPWNDDTLRQALGVDKTSLLLQYLGTRCRFLQGRVPEGPSVMTFVAIVSYSTDSPPKITPRILETRWTTS
jgi:hypothetical protein